MHPYFAKRGGYQPWIKDKPHPSLGIALVIPCFDEPNLRPTLEALLSCTPPQCAVEVIVLINYLEGSDQGVLTNSTLCAELVAKADLKSNSSSLRFLCIHCPNIPRKKAGVGYARKLGMDEAAWRLLSVGRPQGIIAGFDADSTCDPNYLVELERQWREFPKTSGCAIRFEHPLEGSDFEPRVYRAICQYELHLRYYVEAGRFVGHPHSYHTLGSSMACTCNAYLKFGGMNTNKAGEDFYFLQKFIPHGNFRELNTTRVVPSARPSYRVPFGTGRAISKQILGPEQELQTYSFDALLSLKPLFDFVPQLLGITPSRLESQIATFHPALKEYLVEIDFVQKLSEIHSNTSTPDAYRKRFFSWFNAFMLMKYLNHASREHFPMGGVLNEALRLAGALGIATEGNHNGSHLLLTYRQHQSNE